MTEQAVRRAMIARWLQQADEELLYNPDEQGSQTDGVDLLTTQTNIINAINRTGMPVGMRWLYYILEGHTVVVAPDMETWARFCDGIGNRRVAETCFTEAIRVSTVFLTVNHNWGSGPPILFESMCFGGPMDDACERYHTWEEAEAGHAEMCAEVRAALAAAPVGEGTR